MQITGLATPSTMSRVLAYQNAELVERFKDKLAITADEAPELFMDLKRFLFLCGAYPDTVFIPSKIIDQAWHAFILYTWEYNRFCMEMFGEFLHHQPKSYLNPESSSGPGRSATYALAAQTFGKLSDNWGKNAEDAAKCERNCSLSCHGGRNR